MMENSVNMSKLHGAEHLKGTEQSIGAEHLKGTEQSIDGV